MANSSILFENVSLIFKVCRNPNPAFKEIVVNALQGRRDTQSILEVCALKNVSFEIRSGERVGVVGFNGAGKSTLLRTLVGVYAPSHGRVTVEGKVVPLIELGTGFDVELNARENILLNGSLLAKSPKEMAELQDAILDFAELNEFSDVAIKYYSSGMIGRLAFSIATMIDPEILLIDEIFSTGDASFVQKSVDRMNDLITKSDIVVITGHDTNLLSQICTRILVIDKGQLINDGKPEEMIEFYEELVAKRRQLEVVGA